MEDFVKQARGRIEEGHRQLVEIVGASQFEVEAARQAFQETRDKMVTDADTGRSHVEDLVKSTQELLFKTSEQAHGLLAELNAQVSVQTQRAERLCNTTITEGTQTLNSLQSQLAEARAQADRSRNDLEAVVQSATNEFTNMRGAFTTDMKGYEEDVGRLRESAQTARTEIAKRIEEARSALDETGDTHRRELDQLRREASSIVSEADRTLKAICEQSGGTLEAARADMTGISQQVSHQLDRLREGAGAQLSGLQTEIDDALSRGQEAARQVQDKLGAVDQSLRAHSAELLRRLEAEQTAAHEAADVIRSDLAKQVQTARDELSNAAQAHARELTGRLDEALARGQEAARQVQDELSAADQSLQTHSAELLRRLAAEQAAAREAADAIRSDLAKQVQTARDELSDAAQAHTRELTGRLDEALARGQEATRRIQDELGAADESLQTHSAELLRRLAAEQAAAREAADVIRSDLAKQVQTARDELSDAAQAHTRELTGRLDETRERAGREVSHLLNRVEEGVARGAESAERIGDKLRGEIESLNVQACDLHDQVEAEGAGMRVEFEQIASDTRAQLDDAYQRMESLKRLADAALEELSTNVEGMQSGLKKDLASGEDRVRHLLELLRNEATTSTEEYRQKIASVRGTVIQELMGKTADMQRRVEAAT
ncbi:MAG: hypothetical protein ACE5EF_13080, partial [Dehalococcoidia bacterium]